MISWKASFTLLWIQFVFLGAILWLTGQLAPLMTIDSWHYLEFSEINPFSARGLSLYRTMGYPFLVGILKRVHIDTSGIPTVHYIVYAAAVTFFWYALKRRAVMPITALLLASSLFYGNALSEQFFAKILTESFAFAFLIMAVSFLLLDSRWAWIGLGVFTTFCYWLRPAQQTLLVIVPVTAALVPLLSGRALRHSLREFLRIGAVTSIPFLLLCTYRWYLVGEFGLVNFSGRCLFGLVGQFLGPEMVPKLPTHLRELAAETLMRRENLSRIETHGMWKIDYRMWGVHEWEDPAPGRFSLNRRIVDRQFDLTMWGLGQLTQQRRYGRNLYIDDSIAADKELGELAWAILRLRPIPYVLWVFKAGFHALVLTFTANSGMGFVLVVSTGLLLLFLMRVQALELGLNVPEAEKRLFLILTVFNMLQIPLNILVTVGFTMPLSRYVAGPALFVPMVPLILMGSALRGQAPRPVLPSLR